MGGKLARVFEVATQKLRQPHIQRIKARKADGERPRTVHSLRIKINKHVLRLLIRVEDSVVIEGNTLQDLICLARSGWTEMPFLCVLVAMRWQQPSCCYSSA